MKKKTGMYLVIGIIGIALALIAKFLLQDYLSDSQSGAMIGIGAGLFGYGKDGFMLLVPAPQDLVTGEPNQTAIATVHIEKYD